jgi:hypothetical protein
MLTSFGVSSGMSQCQELCFFLRDSLRASWEISNPDSFKYWLSDGIPVVTGITSMQVEVAEKFGDMVCSFYEKYGLLRKRCDSSEHKTLARLCHLGGQVDLSIDTLVVLIARTICECHMDMDTEEKQEAFLRCSLVTKG